ncbi:helix-turn-helix domain-containing protein [Bradyrhizobium sp. Ash2021]|uniref:helix-turn-helix domain-containing protein n=1 Tax=Bradyrhizobium sp. Ash2021 TaxID=2954771 RepID=UPI002815CB99|nr:helix-turn-helix domain-containing protein [Bradyrhizobium sp. Ash2021]WMT73368.1 helix-turn-helix domain-containing protein [Bradyrhizobium sp. Ash2021]
MDHPETLYAEAIDGAIAHRVGRDTAKGAGQPLADLFFLIAAQSGVLATAISYEPDEEIYGEAEPSDYIYQVVNGAVRSYKLLDDGRRQIEAFHLKGDVFGLEFGPAFHTTAEAIVKTTVRRVKRRSLEIVAATNAQVAFTLWKMAARNLQVAGNHILRLGSNKAIERVANFLLEIGSRFSSNLVCALPMYRRDIGDYLGLTIETISRTLSQLRDEGAIQFCGPRQIILRNRQHLSSLIA